MRDKEGSCTQSTCKEYDSKARKHCNRLLSIPKGECEIFEKKGETNERR